MCIISKIRQQIDNENELFWDFSAFGEFEPQGGRLLSHGKRQPSTEGHVFDHQV